MRSRKRVPTASSVRTSPHPRSIARQSCADVEVAGRLLHRPPAPPQPGQKIDCGFMIGFGRMNVGGMPMTNLAQALSPMVGRIVLDKTELAGNYDFELTYSPEGIGSAFPGGGPPPEWGPPPVDPNTPTIFTALQEQLGLKLDSQRGPVEVVVIDRVEQPIAD